MLQNKAIRFILNLRGICSISEAKAGLKIDSLESRRYASRTRSLANIMSHPEYHGALFDDLSSMFSLTDAEHVHVTRSISNSLPRSVTTNTNLFYNSFLPRTARELRLSQLVGGACFNSEDLHFLFRGLEVLYDTYIIFIMNKINGNQ